MFFLTFKQNKSIFQKFEKKFKKFKCLDTFDQIVHKHYVEK